MTTLTPEQFKAQYGEDTFASANSVRQTTKRPSAFQTLKDVGIGFAKGAGATVKGAVDIGKSIQSVLPEPISTIPGGSTGPSVFDGINLKAENPAQMVGKVGEFAAEVLFPTGLLTKGGKAANATLDKIGTRISTLPDDAIVNGVKVKDRLMDLVANLDDRTKTALSRTSKEKFDEILQQGKAALMDDRNRTPLESVGDNVIEGLKQLKSQADSIGQKKSELIQSANVGFKKVGNIAQKAALDVQKAFSGVKLDNADMKVINQFKDELAYLGNNPSLKEVDATIDLLQDQLYKSTRGNAIEVTDRVTGKLRNALGKLNSQLKEIGGSEYQKLNQEYADAITIVNELNARLGKEGASAGAFVKRLFSPSDARTKELFSQLEKYTGQDYFRDARLAKFVMDTLGDTRAESLLNQIPMTKSGAVGKAIDFVTSKLSDPIDAAKRFIEKKGPQSIQDAYGAVAGVEVDDNGNITFNPLSAAAGIAGVGVAGSLGKAKTLKLSTIVKNMDKKDRDTISSFLDNRYDINEYIKVRPFLDAVGVPDGANLDQVTKFLKEVMNKYNG